ncbi:hypothetical protein ACIQMJ_32935 [Actinosynnema sp. NPDC091369]
MPTYGQVITVAGTGEEGYSGDGRPAADARISGTGTIDVGPDGTLYLVDRWARRVRAVNGDGVIDTVPGTRVLRTPQNDGPEVNGRQHSPSDGPQAVAVGQDGALYVAGRETVRRIGRDGSSTTLARVGAHPVHSPGDIAVDADGNIYVSNDGRVHKIDPAGRTTTIAGGGSLDPLDADGKAATEARLGSHDIRIAVDSRASVYLVAPSGPGSNRERSSVHRVDTDGVLRTVAGSGEPGFSGDGGPAASARVSSELGGVDVDGGGNLYFHDAGNGVVRVVGADGTVTSIASLPRTAGAHSNDLAVGPRGDVYVRTGAHVRMVARGADEPTARSTAEPTYAPRFSDDEPGAVRTVAGSDHAERLAPSPPTYLTSRLLRVAGGPDGSRYYSDAEGNRVVKIAPDGSDSPFAGTGESGFGGDGAAAAQALLNHPTGLDVGPDGSVYVADSGNHRVRRIDPNGVITTVAGNGRRGDRGGNVAVLGDGGPATAATVTPVDVAVGVDGSLYLADGENSRIRRVAPDGTISTVAGGGRRWKEAADGHPAVEAGLGHPSAVAVGRDGAVYLLDGGIQGVWPSVRMIDPRGGIRTVAGSSYRYEEEGGFGGDGGPAVEAELNNPHDIATGPNGTLYIADTYNARIRAVTAEGVITTVAGTGVRADSGDGGDATTAGVGEPQAVDVDGSGSVLTVNLRGDRTRRIDRGAITTIATPAQPSGTAGRDADESATEVAVDAAGMAVDHDGALFVADRTSGVYRITADGAIDRSFADHAEFARPEAVAVGPDGSRYIASGGAVHRLTAGGTPVLVAGGGPVAEGNDRVEPGHPATIAHFRSVVDLAVSAGGVLYVATPEAAYRLDDGKLTTVYDRADDGREQLRGIAVDAERHLYIAVSDEGHDSGLVHRVNPDGERVIVAGNGASTGQEGNGDGDDATGARLEGALDVAVDDSGNLYIGTYGGIRRVDGDGTITTVSTNPSVDGVRDGIGPLALDRHGDLYYADRGHKQVKLLVQPEKITEPSGWHALAWITSGVLALAAVAWFGLRRHRRTPRKPTAGDGPATDRAASPATSAEE